MNTNLEISGVGNQLKSAESKGIANCFNAYAKNCENEWIFGVGYNQRTGYAYIALENGVQICSQHGGKVEYLVTDPENGDETFYDSYKKATKHEYAPI
jgi:hypothetical protein